MSTAANIPVPENLIRSCLECGNQFYRMAPVQKFCSDTCREKAQYRNEREALRLGRELMRERQQQNKARVRANPT
jgi:hypothetical protein